MILKPGSYMKTITREKYLERMIELNGTPDIKIITCIRRSGKSKLMQAYMEYLKSHFENINIIFIDFMDLPCPARLCRRTLSRGKRKLSFCG